MNSNDKDKIIGEDKKERALELYIKGKASIEKSANFADLHIGKFLDLVREKGIESNITSKDFEESIKHSKKLRI